jgi:hypothetical protein
MVTLWVISVRRHGPIDTMMPAPPPLNLEPPVIEYENEIVFTPTPASPAQRPTRHDVAFSIGAVLKEAKACMEGIGATAFVSWQVNPDGSASDVRYDPPPNGLDVGVVIGPCLLEVVKKTRVAPYDGQPVRVRYPFRNLPTAEQMRDVAKMLGGSSAPTAPLIGDAAAPK